MCSSIDLKSIELEDFKHINIMEVKEKNRPNEPMVPSHLRMDASVITSFTCGFDQEHIYQMATITIYNLISLLEILKMLLKRISIPTNAFNA